MNSAKQATNGHRLRTPIDSIGKFLLCGKFYLDLAQA
jgi:hypothetical protein